MKIVKEINNKPKLRLFKQIMHEDDDTEKYVKLNISCGERSILAQLRMGILPIRIESGRITNLKLDERLCQICKNGEVEDEMHFAFDCRAYETSREIFFNKIMIHDDKFVSLNNVNKLKLCFEGYVRKFAKFLLSIFQERKDFEYN